MIAPFEVGKDHASKGVLDALKTGNGGGREIEEEGVAKVKARGDKGVGKDSGRGSVERGPQLPKLAELKEGSTANGGDVVSEGEVVVKGDAKVASGRGGLD